MSIKRLQELLNSDKNPIKINRDLLKVLDLEEAVLYSCMVSEYSKRLKKDNYKFFNGEMYILFTVDSVARTLNMSSFRQRSVLNKLQKKGLLKVKLGQARTRYIWINDNPESLERIIFGIAISDFEQALNEYLEEQIENFKEENNLYINNKYLFDYGTPLKTKLPINKHIDLNDNFSQLGLGWLAKEEEITRPVKSKIRA